MSTSKFGDSASSLREGVDEKIEMCTYCSLFFSMHISESQQEFFRMLDEKIEKVRSEIN